MSQETATAPAFTKVLTVSEAHDEARARGVRISRATMLRLIRQKGGRRIGFRIFVDARTLNEICAGEALDTQTPPPAAS